jgi:hypothetical protein
MSRKNDMLLALDSVTASCDDFMSAIHLDTLNFSSRHRSDIVQRLEEIQNRSVEHRSEYTVMSDSDFNSLSRLFVPSTYKQLMGLWEDLHKRFNTIIEPHPLPANIEKYVTQLDILRSAIVSVDLPK